MDLKTKSLYKQLIGDSFYYFLTKIIPGITGLLSVIFFVRHIGVDGYGKFSILYSFIMAVGALSSGWLNQGILRYYSLDGKKAKFSQNIFYGLTLSILISFIFLFLSNKLFLKLNYLSFGTAFLLLISIILFRLKTSLLQADLSAYKVSKVTAIQSLLGLLIPLIILLFIKNYLGILVGLSIAYIITGYNFLNINHTSYSFSINKNNKFLYKYYKFGIPTSLRISIGLLIPFIDRWLIMLFYDESLTGIYSSYSEIIIKVFAIMLFPITLAIHPLVNKFWNNGEKNTAFSILKKAIGIYFAIFIIAVFCLLAFDNSLFYLIQKLIPDITNNFKNLLVPIFISGFLWQLSLLIHKPLELAEKPINMVYAIVIALGFSFVGNIILIPKIGIISVAYNSVISSTVYILVVLFFIKTNKNINFY